MNTKEKTLLFGAVCEFIAQFDETPRGISHSTLAYGMTFYKNIHHMSEPMEYLPFRIQLQQIKCYWKHLLDMEMTQNLQFIVSPKGS